MRRGKALRGEATQGERPDWAPLRDLVGEEVTGDFMWMFEVKLSDGRRLQAYKHIDTRRYVHLDAVGQAFVDEVPDGYRVLDTAYVLAMVFAPLPGLDGVTEQQIAASREALARVRGDDVLFDSDEDL